MKSPSIPHPRKFLPCMSANEPTRELEKQPANEEIDQPTINKVINRPISQPIIESGNQPINRGIAKQSIRESTNH
uniref:Uncharacterized protein n=1 Tax=Romanomermis culicivorax TaxID=13658 RepID=A0A915J4P9_ROMCU